MGVLDPIRERRAVASLLSASRIAVSLIVIVSGSWFVWDLVTNRFNVRQNDTNQFGVGLASHRFPTRAEEFLDANMIDGKIFHTMQEGAYLLAHRHPVFIDPRLEVYGEERVGLLTGDNSVNGRADVVVMTTEVLRNMIYASSSALDDLHTVILDEVHFLGDRSRGQVWEE